MLEKDPGEVLRRGDDKYGKRREVMAKGERFASIEDFRVSV